MRLFYAVAADAEVRAAAAGVVSGLRRAPGDYRWVDPRDMHLTLRFLGETPEERLPDHQHCARRHDEGTRRPGRHPAIGGDKTEDMLQRRDRRALGICGIGCWHLDVLLKTQVVIPSAARGDNATAGPCALRSRVCSAYVCMIML